MPVFAAIPAATSGSSRPTCSDAFAEAHAAHGDRQRLARDASVSAKTCAFPHDIVADCDSTTRDRPCRGKLGVLLVGLGAVSTTTIAGVLAIRKGLAQPIGSLTQMGTIRLGKRTEAARPRSTSSFRWRTSNDIVFGGWDIFEEDCYAAARTAGVLEPSLLEQVRPSSRRSSRCRRCSISGT